MNSLSIYNSKSSQASYNLALEEYLLLHSDDDILLFYFNDKAVILGKHQNPWKEVDLNFCSENKIDVRRRLSGGGTVYHDLNNLNFSYIRNKSADFVNFREHIEPISNALKLMGLDNTITERNDIFVGDKKISGNAEHVNNTKKRILHHGTLLIDSDLTLLRKALSAPQLDIDTHAVNSVRSSVSSISQYLSFNKASDVHQQLIKNIKSLIDINSIKEINPETIDEVKLLVKDKYSEWNWNFGHSPQFNFRNASGETFTIRKGKYLGIDSVQIADKLKNTLIDQPFDSHQLLKKGIFDPALIKRITIS